MALTADRVTNVPVPFRQLRMKDAEGALQEGVVGAADLKVAQRGAGANMSVDIPVGACWVQIDTGTRNGLVHVYNDAVANVTFNASDATNPRIDQIGVQYNDSSIPAGTGGNTPTFRYLPGTATAGAQAANPTAAGYRAGAAAAPNDWIRLADILIPAASTSVVTANIVDRRPWARGLYRPLARSSGDITPVTATNWTAIDAATLQVTGEFSGTQIEVGFAGSAQAAAAGTWTMLVGYSLDGDLVGAATASARSRAVIMQQNFPANIGSWWRFAPAAGRHTLTPIFRLTSATSTTIFSSTTNGGLEFYVREVVVPAADNT